jgi:hypothetical protein
LETTATAYNDSIDADEQIRAEEELAGLVFDAVRELDGARGLEWRDCDGLALSALSTVLGYFPTGYQVQEDDFKDVRRKLARTILRKQEATGGRSLGEEGCAQLGRDLLLEALAFLRPDLVD